MGREQAEGHQLAELSTDSANPVAAEPIDRVGFGPMDDIRLTRDLAAAGFDFTEVDRMRRRGELRRIRRGAYEDGNREMGEPVEQHRRLIEATLRQASVNRDGKEGKEGYRLCPLAVTCGRQRSRSVSASRPFAATRTLCPRATSIFSATR